MDPNSFTVKKRKRHIDERELRYSFFQPFLWGGQVADRRLFFYLRVWEKERKKHQARFQSLFQIRLQQRQNCVTRFSCLTIENELICLAILISRCCPVPPLFLFLWTKKTLCIFLKDSRPCVIFLFLDIWNCANEIIRLPRDFTCKQLPPKWRLPATFYFIKCYWPIPNVNSLKMYTKRTVGWI